MDTHLKKHRQNNLTVVDGGIITPMMGVLNAAYSTQSFTFGHLNGPQSEEQLCSKAWWFIYWLLPNLPDTPIATGYLIGAIPKARKHSVYICGL